MRRTLIILTAVFVTAGALVIYALQIGYVYVVHGDACHVIALAIASHKAGKGSVSEAEIQAIVASLASGSVIHARVGADGSPTDLNGNPFVIHHDEKHVHVDTQRSFWQPFAVEYEAEVESSDKSPARKSDNAGR